MPSDGTYTGVADRFEEAADGTELGVILVESGGEVVDQLDIPRDELPSDVGQGSVLELAFSDGDVVGIEHRPEESRSRAEEAQNRFDRLSQRPPDRSDTDSNNQS